ncbi:hypothetical protein ACH4LN_24765 [Streptomyces albus]|uniref:Uncharacterized protein n=1 Tax=Streptomyces albus TaxID=1888 RepID=A0A6C1BZ77_9ACTN|nr:MULTISPECIES: hypothetical protein [Streptomyces]KPC65852.1 lipoprotein [Streptomyces sp. NRRL F-6602]EPD96852.1 hypothetical protein HMPREF1486_00462 [Streptomyces sp. HPH0547]QID34957.1 hypothetical protein G3260_000844 [Streptomyces albus]TGG76238.1 hypothetical protein D8771_29970 [Streptomyces albus]UVN58238.1 hypothetical protein NR995_29710 [Streptomyces albus]
MRDQPREGALPPEGGAGPRHHSEQTVAPATSLAVASARAAVWTGRATSRLQWALAALGAGCLALGIELAVDPGWSSGLVPLVMSVVGCVATGLLILCGTLAFVHVEVRVEDEALEVRCGHAGVPRRRIHLRDVVAADHAPRLTPCHWGGWGYRSRPEKGTAVIIRRGEGLVLRLGDGRVFTVTVDDAETAVHHIRTRLAALRT